MAFSSCASVKTAEEEEEKEEKTIALLTVSDSCAPKIDILPCSLETLTSSQVFVCQSLRPGVFSFKSVQGRYLSSNSLGQLQCNKEAVGPAEEWIVSVNTSSTISTSSTSIDSSNTTFSFSVKSSLYGKYLSLLAGKIRVDADADEVQQQGGVRLLCQAALRKERLLAAFMTSSSASRQQSQDDLSKFAQAQTRKYSGGKTKICVESDLQAAADEGTLREALLQKRIKAKHDPFC
jgi:protein FRG1